MPVPNSMADLSTFASSNFPTGTESIGNSLDNYIRAVSAIIRSTNGISSATIAAASTTDVGSSDCESVVISGVGTINSFGTGFAGCRRELRFQANCTITASSNIVTAFGANITVDSGDVVLLRCTGSGVWTVTGVYGPNVYSRLAFIGNGTAVVVAPSAAGGVFLRPNGPLSTTGQALVASNGNLTLGGRIVTNSYVESSGADLVLSCNGGTMIFRPNGSGSGLNGATLAASNGDFTVTGNLISLSDERVKKNWQDVSPDLVEKIATVKRGVYERSDTGATQVGISAQSLKSVMPQAVIEGEDGKMAVAYGNAALVAVCEVAERLLKLEKSVAANRSL